MKIIQKKKNIHIGRWEEAVLARSTRNEEGLPILMINNRSLIREMTRHRKLTFVVSTHTAQTKALAICTADRVAQVHSKKWMETKK